MKPTIHDYGLGIQKIPITIHNDERGFLGEVFRQDWNDILPEFNLKQVLISHSNPGVIRAWHRHLRNQIDLFFVLKGTVKISVFDGDKTSKTFGDLIEIIADEKHPQLIKIPGHLWHGTKNIGKLPSETIYFMNNLYDYDNPDEERIEWNDQSVINPKTQKPYDWNVT